MKNRRRRIFNKYSVWWRNIERWTEADDIVEMLKTSHKKWEPLNFPHGGNSKKKKSETD